MAQTEYKDWYNVGQEKSGYFPLVDFQKGDTLVSVKSVDTAGTTWMGRMQDHIIDLGKSGATVMGYLFNHCGGGAACWEAFKDATSMATDWALGTGSANRTFGAGSVQVMDMVDAPGVNGARDLFYQKNAAAIASGGKVQEVTNYSAKFGLWDLLTNSSPTQQFVGSYRVDVFPDGSDMRFVVTNNSSFRSFVYGIAPAWERSSFGPAGNMRQIYTWTESIK